MASPKKSVLFICLGIQVLLYVKKNSLKGSDKYRYDCFKKKNAEHVIIRVLLCQHQTFTLDLHSNIMPLVHTLIIPAGTWNYFIYMRTKVKMTCIPIIHVLFLFIFNSKEIFADPPLLKLFLWTFWKKGIKETFGRLTVLRSAVGMWVRAQIAGPSLSWRSMEYQQTTKPDKYI